MESEDDIFILGAEEDEVDWGTHLFSPPSPFHTKTADTGSHHALQKAYLELKKRFNETSLRNQTLQQRINHLETLRGTAGLINMNEDNMSYGAQGGAAMPGAVEAQMAAEEGFVTMLQRDLARQKAQVQRLSTIEVKYQDVLRQNESLKQQLASLSQAVNEKGGNSSSTSIMQLSQQLREMQDCLLATIHEKDALELKHAKLLEEKEQAVKSREELRTKCQSLEIERSSMEGSCLNNSLQKANQNSRSLKAQSLPCCHPPELFSEVTHMRKVIDSLKKMVLQQRQCLVELEGKTSFSSVRSSMSRSVKAISNVELDMMPNGSSSRNSGSESSQSWELVNGVQQHAEDARLLHQASRTLPEREPSRVAATSNSVQNGGSVISNASSTIAQPVRRASTEVIFRKTDGDSLRQKKVKTEYIRSSQDLANTNLAIWMDHHSQQQTGATEHGDMMTFPDTSPVPVRGNLAGHPQQQSQQWGALLKKDAADVPHSNTAPSQPLPLQFVQNQPGYYNLEHQMSPIRDLPSSYDNVPPAIPFNRVPNTSNMVRNSDGTSLHVLNQSVMAGARVLRNGMDGFAGSRGNVVTSSAGSVLPPASGVTRGSPQEHSDLSSGQTQTRAVNYQYLPPEPVASQTNNTNRAGADRKCPVCGQDFSHISMDEFQTHVFECFDDSEDTSAPETLQPQKNTDSEDRVCPMCEKEFNASFSQTAFEQHVESHFDDTIDRFELLDVTRT